ncbi:acetyl-CoA carboxylase biotin carboxyl carrier protein [Anthocerotibacter panamensis]|uniref:acetyl-CoA carboxylase biotin carboxyl carrier protein n=1 Tax=Anthocerotibacter panamensis TaxID=2857077 RepID=UPI001C406727|nr:acetyl-CoA carboxylase biotin carboxyl carrier protein [Anthocerotibacter panamensis]
MNFDLAEVRELITLLNKTDITELELEGEGYRLILRKSAPVVAAAVAAPMVPATKTPATQGTQPTLLEVKAPMVGTFYRATAPESPPFVDLNDRVRVGQTVCIIEAMKLMNNIEAEVSGRVVEVLVENGQPVEFGQVLMRLEPENAS